MKRVLTFTLITLIIYSCSNVPNELHGKWYVIDVRNDEGEISYFDTCDYYIEFFKDKKYEAKGLVESKGIWKYSEKLITIDDTLDLELLELNQNLLKYQFRSRDSVNVIITSSQDCNYPYLE
ncbi:MAG: hypothetical protein GQ574_22225 [Crocinitomix sp.]|nr:hypothetical protein [Crocinitomix sp.]